MKPSNPSKLHLGWASILLQILFAQFCCTELELRVAFITTYSGQYVSNGSLPAVVLAVDEVNEVLAGRYRLHLNTSTITCERTDSLRTYFENINQDGAPLIALLGCGCSPATEPVAEISHYADIVHISYVSSSPILSDRSRFQSFWRTYPSDASVNPAVLAVVKQYGWRKVKVITQDETLFVESTRLVTSMLESNGVGMDRTGPLLLQSTEPFRNISSKMLFSPEVRVFFLNMYERHAREVLCQASMLGDSDSRHYTSGYVWILHGWYKQRWWTAEVANDATVNCTDKQLEDMLLNSISIVQIPSPEDRTAPTDVVLTTDEFQERYEESLGNKLLEPAAALAYDAVWVLAHALNRSDANDGRQASVVEEIREQLSSANFSFNGVSGVVQFDATGSRRPHSTRILKYRATSDCPTDVVADERALSLVEVAVLSNESENLTYVCEVENGCSSGCESDQTVWPGGVPADGTPTKVIATIITPVFVIFTILANIGIVFVVICFIFNIIFRKRRIVKLTSPNLNYVVLVGAFFLYSSIYFYVLPSREQLNSTVYCHVRAWLQPGGYLICFGTIMLKMWRVYYIFHHPSAKKKRKVPKDWMLFLGVLALFAVFAVIMIGVTLFDDYKATEVPDQVSSTERNENKVLVEHSNLVCDGRRSLIWIIMIFVYILAAQLIAVYLAFKTRKVKIKALNDAKYLAFIIYITTIISTGMIIGSVSLRNFLNVDAAVFSAGLFLFTTAILGLLFVPKMFILYKDPNGEFIFNRSMSQGQTTNISLSDGERDKLRDLETHCKDLENRLAKYENVRPFRSSSKARLGSTSDLGSSIQLTLKSPLSEISPKSNQTTTSALPPESSSDGTANVSIPAPSADEKFIDNVM